MDGSEGMDETIIKIVKARLKRWEGQTLDKVKLNSLRTEIYDKTRTNKFAPFSNIKKWVHAARKAIAADAKSAAKSSASAAKKSAASASKSKSHASSSAPAHIPAVSAAVQNSLDDIKSEMDLTPRQEVVMPKAPVVLDKVYLQSISFEIAAMRSAMDRIGRQLDKLERELNQHRQMAE